MKATDFDTVADVLASIFGVTVRREVLLSENTTWRIGGPVALWVEVIAQRPHFDNVVDVVATLTRSDVDFTVLGGGSNILGADAGYRGAVIHLANDDPFCVFSDDCVIVSADMVLSALVKQSAEQGFCDLEFLTGIPGTVGGALAMNAGTGEVWIGSVVDEVVAVVYGAFECETVDSEDCTSRPRVVRLRGDELVWDYRSGSLRDRAIIVEATLKLTQRDEPSSVLERMRDRLAKRRAGQPLDYPSAGSVFRNPDGDNAWRLVDAVGLKGTSAGGAQLSEMHTNFIINRGDATASDVLQLIDEAQRRVYEEYGIRLQKEVRLLGSET